MPNSDAVASEILASRDAPRVAAAASTMTSLHASSVLRTRATLTDNQSALLLSAVLFVVAAWPLALTEVPPFQDLPNHLAAVTVIENPDRYPEFVFNGFVKTNAALFAWLYAVGKIVGAKAAARLFALLVVAANALVLPRTVLELTGSRGRMIVASLLVWPMVHNWFVSMGMLDFALSVPLSLGLLLLLQRHRTRPSLANAVGATLLGVVTWYAHVFPLLVVHMLVAIEIVVQRTWKDRFAAARAMIPQLSPVTLLVAISLLQHLRDTVGPMTGYIDYRKTLPAWELAYNLWAEWFWGFSKLTLSSLVPCVVLAIFGLARRKESPPFFSPLAFLALGVLYCFLPYIVTNWFHVNSRLIPFFWMACVLRVPDALPRWLASLLGASGVLYSAGMGADYVRLEKERSEFIAGIPSVPEGAKLLPLLFRHKAASENTRNILHAWGYYVTDKLTAAPLLFSHSHSFPVMYRSPPPPRFNHLLLEGFASSMAQPSAVCRSMLDGNVVVDDCMGAYRAAWSEFWIDAMPRFDHLLVWDAPPEARRLIPPAYHVVFEQGRLAIYARDGAGSSILELPDEVTGALPLRGSNDD